MRQNGGPNEIEMSFTHQFVSKLIRCAKLETYNSTQSNGISRQLRMPVERH